MQQLKKGVLIGYSSILKRMEVIQKTMRGRHPLVPIVFICCYLVFVVVFFYFWSLYVRASLYPYFLLIFFSFKIV